jgi:hypothetical protein
LFPPLAIPSVGARGLADTAPQYVIELKAIEADDVCLATAGKGFESVVAETGVADE